MYVTSPNHFFAVEPAHVQKFLSAETGDRSITRTIQAGNLLYCEGDKSPQVYEIIEGVVRSSKILRDGRRQVIAFGYPGDILGISHDCRHHSDCEAVSDVKVRVHRKNACSSNVNDEPQFCSMLLKHTASEMNNMQEHFMMLGRKSAHEKVSSFLTVLLDRVGEKGEGCAVFSIPMPRSDIADFLGLTIETVSRTLTKLRKEGVIDLPNPHQVKVLKLAALRACAEQNE